MNSLPTAIRTVRWMVRDTFRQSLASKLFWVMLGITLLCTAFCFGITVTGDEEAPRHPDQLPLYMPKSQDSKAVQDEGLRVVSGEVSLGFGLFKFPITKHRSDSVRLLQLWLAGVLADTVGVLLALLWTAGFLPTFLEPQAITVLLAKPAPRWSLLVGQVPRCGVVRRTSRGAVRRGDVDRHRCEHGRLGRCVLARGSAPGDQLRGLLRLQHAPGGLHPQHGCCACSGLCCSGCCAGR